MGLNETKTFFDTDSSRLYLSNLKSEYIFDFFSLLRTVQTAWLIHVGVAPKLISYFLIAHTNE